MNTNLARLFLVAIAMTACGPVSSNADAQSDGNTTVMDASADQQSTDSGTTSGTAPGGACTCDDECAGDTQHPGLCVFGICMQRAASACASAGSSSECNAGLRCWTSSNNNRHLCYPDCDRFTCAGTCDDDGSCVGDPEQPCDQMCASTCPPPARPRQPCSAMEPMGLCPAGAYCRMGSCVPEATSTPGDCPAWQCTGAECTQLILVGASRDPNSEQARQEGYYAASPMQYSYIRRDLAMLVRYAACRVMRRFPNTTPLGLSDLSQSDGRTPGTDVNSLRHASTTHRGDDLDIAYYQTDGSNNPQIVCGDGTDRNANGRTGRFNDGYFCTSNQNIVDWEREAYFFGIMATTSLVRVFGIDQTMPEQFRMHITALRDRGELTAEQASRALRLGYGADGGWQFHHHHVHLSYNRPAN